MSPGRFCVPEQRLQQITAKLEERSRPDFIHKLRIVLKELNETAVWLQLILTNSMLPTTEISPVIAENEELCRIIAASIKTAGGFERT
jgi:four helix bundle protein